MSATCTALRHHRTHLLLIVLLSPLQSTATATTAPAISSRYDYDVFVIGGGSGGLACAKEAAALGATVGLCDYVRPSPRGTSWGLGGTCVNVGCIPKKLMHRAGQLKRILREDAPAYGHGPALAADGGGSHDWPALVRAVQRHVKSLNFGYRAALSEAGARYFNARGSLVGGHVIALTGADGKVQHVSAKHIVLAVGGRPHVPDSFSGAAERIVTSDDLFQLKTPPGKTLVVGGGYVALECAGFLASLGHEVSVMIRSVPLRGFDEQCAALVLDSVAEEGATILRGATPLDASPLDATGSESAAGSGLGARRTRVRWRQEVPASEDDSGAPTYEELSDDFDTVLVATGRHPETGSLNLESVGLAPG